MRPGSTARPWALSPPRAASCARCAFFLFVFLFFFAFTVTALHLEVFPPSHSVLVKGPEVLTLLRLVVEVVPPPSGTLLLRMTDVNAPNSTVVVPYHREVELRLDANVIGTVVYRFEVGKAAVTVLYHVVWRADVPAAAAATAAAADDGRAWARPPAFALAPFPRPLRVLHVAGGAFDGQKQIMLSQWQSVDPAHVHFLLLWVCPRPVPDPNDPVACPVDPTVEALLARSPHVAVAKWSPVPLLVSDVDLHAAPAGSIGVGGSSGSRGSSGRSGSSGSNGSNGSSGNSTTTSSSSSGGSLSDYLGGADVTADGVSRYLVHRLRAAAPCRSIDATTPAWTGTSTSTSPLIGIRRIDRD